MAEQSRVSQRRDAGKPAAGSQFQDRPFAPAPERPSAAVAPVSVRPPLAPRFTILPSQVSPVQGFFTIGAAAASAVGTIPAGVAALAVGANSEVDDKLQGWADDAVNHPHATDQAAYDAANDAVYESIGTVTIDDAVVTSFPQLTDYDYYYPDGDREEMVARALFANGSLSYASNAIWEAEVKMRAALIDAMERLNNTGAEYNFESDDWNLPAATWESGSVRVQGAKKQNAGFRPREGVTAAAAIDAVFDDVGDDEEIFLDCSTAMAVAHYKALREALGTAAFNAKYGRGKQEVVISPEGAQVKIGAGVMGEAPIHDEVETVQIDTVEELLPGDWVYFKNFSDYDATHEGPAAVWAGEHALVKGDGTYEGFGATETLPNMIAKLVKCYNDQGRKAASPKKAAVFREDSDDSMTGKLPGPLKEVRRLKNPAA